MQAAIIIWTERTNGVAEFEAEEMMSNEDTRRRVLGAILGGAVGFGFGFGGNGWELLLTLGLPVHPSAEWTTLIKALQVGLIFSVPGFVWGVLVAWPHREHIFGFQILAILGLGVSVGLAFALPPLSLLGLIAMIGTFIVVFIPFIAFAGVTLLLRRMAVGLRSVVSVTGVASL